MSFEEMPGKSQSAFEIFGSPEESERFPGSKIITIKEGDTYTRYALRRNEVGQLEGNEFELQEYKTVPNSGGVGFWDNSSSLIRNVDTNAQYRIGPTYKIHEDKLALLEGVLKEKGLEI